MTEPQSSRELLLTRTLVQLADTLVEGFDIVDLFTFLSARCVEILDVEAAGLMLPQPNGKLGIVASSSEAMHVLEVFESQSEEGPCPDCCRSGFPVVDPDLATAYDRWPRFTPRAIEAGFRSVHALPMHVRQQTIGALNLFRSREGQMDQRDENTAQSLADVASIAILHHRAELDLRALNDQLSHALNSRIVIEQAKGIIAERCGVEMAEAFSMLRVYARNNRRRLSDVARDVIDGTVHPESVFFVPASGIGALKTLRVDRRADVTDPAV
ncbi:MAG: GAF and ANTAR domain-containing protein [Acidimicrobiales bacterium]